MKIFPSAMSDFMATVANRVEYNLMGVEGTLVSRPGAERRSKYGAWCTEIIRSLKNSALDFDWLYYSAMEPHANFSTGVIEGLLHNGALEAVDRINDILGKDYFDLGPFETRGSMIVCNMSVYDKDLLADALKNNHEALEEVRDFIDKCVQVGGLANESVMNAG